MLATRDVAMVESPYRFLGGKCYYSTSTMVKAKRAVLV